MARKSLDFVGHLWPDRRCMGWAWLGPRSNRSNSGNEACGFFACQVVWENLCEIFFEVNMFLNRNFLVNHNRGMVPLCFPWKTLTGRAGSIPKAEFHSAFKWSVPGNVKLSDCIKLVFYFCFYIGHDWTHSIWMIKGLRKNDAFYKTSVDDLSVWYADGGFVESRLTKGFLRLVPAMWSGWVLLNNQWIEAFEGTLCL